MKPVVAMIAPGAAVAGWLETSPRLAALLKPIFTDAG